MARDWIARVRRHEFFRRGIRGYWVAGAWVLWRVNLWGIPYRLLRVGPHAPGQPQTRSNLIDEVWRLLTKGDLPRPQDAGVRQLVDGEFATRWPTLWAYLSQTKWEDGSVRQTSSMTVFQSDGMLKGMLKDSNIGMCLWVAGTTFMGLLDVLEAALCDPAADWRMDRRAQGDQARRVKKGS